MRVDLFSVCNWCVYILDERDDKDVLGVNSTAQSFSVGDTMIDDSYFKEWVPWTERVVWSVRSMAPIL